MDHARRIGKPENPVPWKKRYSPRCTTSDKPLVKDDDQVAEDRRLANWRKWLTNREKDNEYYGRSVSRNRGDLMINKQDGYRRKVEIKELAMTVESSYKKRADPQRGNPEFWVTPEFLPKHGNPDWPDIPVTLTKKRLNPTPQLERITLPDLIKREKGLSCETKEANPLNLKKNSTTLGEKVSRKIGRFEAEESGMKKLAVKGTRLGRVKSETPRVPIVTITGVESFEHRTDRTLDEEYAIALKIQDREIRLIEDDARMAKGGKSLDDFSWSLIFQSSEPCITERIIRLENLGTSTITYRWRSGPMGSSLVDQSHRNSQFFFNKNKNLILPGQVTTLPVWYRSRASSYSTELWTLVTDPKLHPAPLIFRFCGYCSPPAKSFSSDVAEVDKTILPVDLYLDRRVRDTEIRDIIEEILKNVGHKRLPSPAYGTFFVEGEIFRAKNPSYFYHPTAVRQLREIYDNSTSHDSPDWSLSLDDLRGVLTQLRIPEVRNESLRRYFQLCRDCLRPSLYRPLEISAISLAYNLFCSFIDKFQTEDERVRTHCRRISNAVGVKNEAHGDTSSSTRASKNSLSSLTPRKTTKRTNRPSSRPRNSYRTSSTEITKRETVSRTLEVRSPRECLLYREIFHIRIRETLANTINEICGIVDTTNNLKDYDEQGPH